MVENPYIHLREIREYRYSNIYMFQIMVKMLQCFLQDMPKKHPYYHLILDMLLVSHQFVLVK